jgi:hypothetical protein
MQRMSGLLRPVDRTGLRLAGRAARSSQLQQHMYSAVLQSRSLRQGRYGWLQCPQAVQPSQSLHSSAGNGKEQRIKRYAGLTADDFRCNHLLVELG